MDIEQIIRELRERFPLLFRIHLQGTEPNSVPEALPPYLAILLAVMDAPPDMPLCFVFPRRGDIARITVVLHALHCLIKRQNHLTYTYGESKFRKGDTVRIHPNKHVFRYGGFDEDQLDYIWLETMDGMGRRKECAAKILPRLEKTTLSRPKGRLDSLIRSPAPAPLDALLGISMFGNQSLIQNEIVILDSHGGFADFAGSIVLQPNLPFTSMPFLRDLLPIGELKEPTMSQQSWLKKWDERNSTGEPLIAVTHSSELLANYCIDKPLHSKLIVANGLARLKHRQSYDDIAESQRLILFASRDEKEMVEVLGNAPTPCRFWWLSGAEINACDGEHQAKSPTGLVGKISRWSYNLGKLNIESVPCDNQELEDVCIRLERLRSEMTENENDPLTKLVSQTWRMLNDASAIFRPLTEIEQQKFASRVGSFRKELQGVSTWLKPEVVNVFSDIASKIESSFSPASKLGINKGSELYRVVRETLSAGSKCALLARNENQVEEFNAWLRQRNIFMEAYSPRTLPENSAFDRVICVSWPGWYSLKQVADMLVAPRITVLAYPFEGQWLNQCKKRLRQRPEISIVTSAEKSGLVTPDEETHLLWPEEKIAEVPRDIIVQPELDIWNFEQRLRAARKGLAASPTVATESVRARYISFVGDAFAFLTETHKVSVATELVSGRVRQNQKLPEREVADIKQGDFVVFPESGDRELVQELADRLLGPEAAELRGLAHLWKDALWSSEMTVNEFFHHAQEFGRSRHIVTIRNWFADSSQIGPGNKSIDLRPDLELIALVTNYELLGKNLDKVCEAIKRLRGAAISAGFRVRDVLLEKLPHAVSQVEDNGTKIDLNELGSAWVVQVDSIAPNTEQRGWGEVNRLLWERSSSITIMFA